MSKFGRKTLFLLMLSFPLSGVGCDEDSSSLLEPGAQTTEETVDLLQLREEEKLARDVYLTLHTQWGNAIFENIGASEQKHMDQVKGLLNGFGIADPVTDDTVGVFVNAELDALFNDLVATGMQSEVDALMVGATIEDLDIFDIREMRHNTSNSAILNVYDSLECGSNNHLRSFTGQLSAIDAVYVPQYLDGGDIDAILTAEQGSCGGGQGGRN